MDNIERIALELENAFDTSSTAVLCNLVEGETANNIINVAKESADPTPLWLSLWYSGEVCCLFADSNVGKSIYAVQIAAEVAKWQRVLYFDFELSRKQFQIRYTDEGGNLHRFSDNLYRLDINNNLLVVENFEEVIVDDIETAALQTGAKVLVIDNLTYLCAASEKGDLASLLMMRLMALKQKHNLSILVLAHTPKRSLSSPITQNDLAGSKKLFNFFDSVFTIGKSAKGENLRYIKQLKVRTGSFEYSANNVIECEIEKRGTMLQFANLGYSTEYEHLKEKENTPQQKECMELREQGLTQREIAEQLGVSKSAINRWLKE